MTPTTPTLESNRHAVADWMYGLEGVDAEELDDRGWTFVVVCGPLCVDCRVPAVATFQGPGSPSRSLCLPHLKAAARRVERGY